MASETIYKKLSTGTLVFVHRLEEYGIILGVRVSWGTGNDPYCYDILVSGEKVRAYGEGLTVIGDT